MNHDEFVLFAKLLYWLQSVASVPAVQYCGSSQTPSFAYLQVSLPEDDPPPDELPPDEPPQLLQDSGQ